MHTVKHYPFLVEDVDRHGNVRLYFRRRGLKKIRIRAPLGSKEFEDSYAAAVEASQSGKLPVAVAGPSPVPNTWRWLCQRYMQSVEFRQLDAKSTQRTRRQILESTWVEPTSNDPQLLAGEVSLEHMSAKAVRILRDRKADFPNAANNRLKAMSRVFKWAVEEKFVRSDPTRDVARLRTSGDGFHAWNEAEVARFEAQWPIGTKERLAFSVLRYLGVRRSDAVGLGKQHLQDGGSFIRIQVEKGKRRSPITLTLPVPAPLKTIIDASPTGDLTFLVTEYGKPFTKAGFGNWFRERCNEAGLPNCSAHGLRKFAATELAHAGATTNQLKAVFGWRTTDMAEHYTRSANQRRLAEEAMSKVGKG